MSGKLKQNRKKYRKISYQKRLKLIDLVQNHHLGVTRASKKLRIKIPTAKVILSSWRVKGKIFKKRHEEHQQEVTVPPFPEEEPEQNENGLQNQLGQESSHALVFYCFFYFLPAPWDGNLQQL